MPQNATNPAENRIFLTIICDILSRIYRQISQKRPIYCYICHKNTNISVKIRYFMRNQGQNSEISQKIHDIASQINHQKSSIFDKKHPISRYFLSNYAKNSSFQPKNSQKQLIFDKNSWVSYRIFHQYLPKIPSFWAKIGRFSTKLAPNLSKYAQISPKTANLEIFFLPTPHVFSSKYR